MAPTTDVPDRPLVMRCDAAAEYPTEERCHIVETSNGAADPALSIARARVEPGVTTRWHHLVGTTERYVIVDGEGLVEIGALPPVRMVAGDVAVIPPGCRQRIANVGAKDLVFLAICTPRFAPSNYRDLGDDGQEPGAAPRDPRDDGVAA